MAIPKQKFRTSVNLKFKKISLFNIEFKTISNSFSSNKSGFMLFLFAWYIVRKSKIS